MYKNKQSSEVSEQKVASSISSTIVAIPCKKLIISYDPDAKDEVMPKYLFPGFPNLVLNCLGSDIAPTALLDEKTKKIPNVKYPLKFFGKRFQDLMDPDAAFVANLLIRGEENDIKMALSLIKINPDLLRTHTIVFDQQKRCIKGTPLQIAAMAGDVDLIEDIPDEEDCGLVRRLIEAGDLSKNEVIEQLKCVASEEAQQKNNERNKRILNAIIKFGKAIISEANAFKDMRLLGFQAHCQTQIAELEKDLEPDPNDIITSGFIFDTKVLYLAAEWFKNNIKDFGDWYSVQSDVFWINGWGKLQDKLSSRDAQIVRAGIAAVFAGVIPARSMDIRDDAPSCLYHSSSSLGVDYCLGSYGTRMSWAVALLSESITEFEGVLMYSNLSDIKIAVLQKLCNNQEISYKNVV